MFGTKAKIRTKIDEDIALRIEEIRRAKKVSFNSVVNALLRKGLDAEPGAGIRLDFEIKSKRLGRPPEHMNLDKVSELIERIDECEAR
jgi:hypothetical protein